MNWHRIANAFRTLVLLVLVLTTVPVALAQGTSNKIEGRLVDALRTQGTADFVVRFAEQADLSPAYAMDWEPRGWFVYNTLTETAARSQARAIQHLEGLGLRHQTFIVGNELYVYAGSFQLANDLAALPEVALIRATRTYYVDPILATAPAAAPQALDWGIVDTNADDFWSTFGMQGDGIVVSNVDTGVQWNHPALDQAFKCGTSPSDPACWADPSNICGGSACDNNGHGTHTMGTMVGDDDPGLTYQAGMAPNAQWIACKGCESSSCSDTALNACADWIVAPGGNPANRPNVVNNSWGGGGGDDWYLAKVQAWRAAGVFPAFSAGNNGSGCNSLGSPGDYQESFGSAAHDSSRNIASFSSRGPSAFGHDPYTKPNISAPGVSICSSVPTDSWSCGYSGTSMASPHTAGAVALLWSCNPGLIGQIDQTFQILQDNADTPPAGNCGAPPDGEGNYTYGYGYLNVYAAGLLWCGDTGWIDGHVTEAGTGNPIDGAVVVAANQSGPGSFSDTTDATGYYTMTALVGTYNMTATAYGYLPGTAAGVVVEDGLVTTHDFALQPAPTYVVSGTVTEAGTGDPLYARVQIVGDPVPPVWTNPATGYYSITAAEGTYTFHVTAAGHASADREVIVDHDQTQDFQLSGLPCILLVDDDQDDSDVQSYYTGALDAMGVTYDVWDILADGEPAAGDLAGYRTVIWFTGYPYTGSFTGANEAAVSAYLDAGGNFFLSSEDYLYEFGLTSFGQNYLGISSYTDDVEETDVVGNAGNPIGDGLGPYNLTAPTGWPGSLWTDYVTGAETPFRFQASGQNNSTNKDGSGWKTVFFGWPLEGIANLNDRVDVLTAIVDYFGGCGAVGTVTGRVTHAYYGTPIGGASVTAAPAAAGVGINATTNPDGYYTLTLALGTYDITAQKTGYTTEVAEGVIVSDTIVVQDFELNSAVAVVTPDSLHAYVTPSGTVTLPLNVDNPGGLDLSFEIAETTATLPLRYVGQDVTVHIPATPAHPDAASRAPAVARPARDLTVHVGWVSQQTVNVLIITPDVVGGGDISLILSTLAAYPDLVVTVWDGNAGTPTVADMQAYDVVFVGNDYLWSVSAIDPTTLSNNLADYIDAGGAVLAGSFLWSYDAWGIPGGRFMIEDYSPYDMATQDFWTPVTLGTYDPDHPIMAGVTAVTDNFNHQDVTVNANGSLVASWSDGYPFVAVAPSCVGLNQEYFGSADFGAQTGDVVHNALVWLAGGAGVVDVPWVSEVPTSSVVPAGTNLDVDVIFTALPPYNVVGESYTATLIISHNDPELDDILVPITMTVAECIPVYEADFAWAPLSPFAGDTVVFTGTASGAEPITYTWDFGDSGTGAGANVTHVYAAAGTYTVTMTAANACPSEITVMYQITVQEPPCPPVEASFTWTPTTPVVDEVVTFDGVATSTAPIVDYAWDLGDGTLANGQTITHSYAATGTYTVLMTATNDCGEFAVVSDVVTVEAPPPCVDVQIVTYTVNIDGCAVDLSLEVTGTAPFTYLWAFGDGITSTLAAPSHTYTQTGTYNVTANVYNCAEGHDMVSFDVTVECGGPGPTYAIYLPVVYKTTTP